MLYYIFDRDKLDKIKPHELVEHGFKKLGNTDIYRTTPELRVKLGDYEFSAEVHFEKDTVKDFKLIPFLKDYDYPAYATKELDKENTLFCAKVLNELFEDWDTEKYYIAFDKTTEWDGRSEYQGGNIWFQYKDWKHFISEIMVKVEEGLYSWSEQANIFRFLRKCDGLSEKEFYEAFCECLDNSTLTDNMRRSIKSYVKEDLIPRFRSSLW